MAQDSRFNLAISNRPDLNQPDPGSDIEIDEFLKQFDPPKPPDVQHIGQQQQPGGPPPPQAPPPDQAPSQGAPQQQPLQPPPGAPSPTPDQITPWLPGTIPAVVEALGFHDPAGAASGEHENINPAVLQKLQKTFPMFSKAVGQYGTVVQDARKTAAALTAPPRPPADPPEPERPPDVPSMLRSLGLTLPKNLSDLSDDAIAAVSDRFAAALKAYRTVGPENFIDKAVQGTLGAFGLGNDASKSNQFGQVLGAALPVVGGLKKAKDVLTAAEEAPEAVAAAVKGAQRTWNYEGAAKLPKAAKPATIIKETLANGGYTVDPVTGHIPSTGFQVGAFPNSNPRTVVLDHADFTPKAVSAFIKQNEDVLAKPNMHVGAWWDKDGSGKVYLDVSEHVDSPTGVRLATKKGELQKQPTVTRSAEGAWPKAQEAIFNNETMEVLPVGNFWEFANSPEMRARMDELHAVGHQVMNGKDWWNLYGGPLAEVYGEDKIRPLAGFLASTSPASTPNQNLRSATEYMRRLLKDEPIIQPGFRIPENAVGWKSGYNGPGKQMPMEQGRVANLLKAAEGDLDKLQADKVNDMAHALIGEDVGVYDRRWAKLFEDWKSGVYAEPSKDKLTGSMVSGKLDNYATIENVVRDAAKRAGEPLNRYSAMVWEGIGKRIKDTGELFGMKQAAHAIPPASEGFNNIFPKMVRDKAAHLGITVPEMMARLRKGDAELLGLVLTTAAGTAAFKLWAQEGHQPPPAAE